MSKSTLVTRLANKIALHARSEAEQRALLDSALYGFDGVRSRIPVGQSANIFSIICVTTLLEYGRLPDGTHPLSRLLAMLRDSLGVDQEWDQLIAEVESSSKAQVGAAETALPSEQTKAGEQSTPAQIVSQVQVTADQSKPKRQSATHSSSGDLLVIGSPFRLELVRVPAGSFWMGSDNKKDQSAGVNELSQHTVYLSEFYIGKYPITVAQFAAFTHASQFITTAEREGSAFVLNGKVWKDIKGANWQYPSGPKSNVTNKQNHPVTCVSWEDAKAFCEWLSDNTGMLFSLPTEAQWEKAARGSDGRIYPWGNEPPDLKRCNFSMNVGDTTPVGVFSPIGDSPYDVADMSGNVWEWAADWYDEKLYATRANRFVKDPVGPASGQHRVLRGGAWDDGPGNARAACRYWLDPSDCHNLIGFRVVRAPVL